MDIELLQIRDFLTQRHPFDQLPKEVMDTIPSQLEIRYVRRNTAVLTPGNHNNYLHIIRTGAVETRDPNNQLLAHLDEGDVFGVGSLMNGGKVQNANVATEDSLIYLMPFDLFRQLCDNHSHFSYYFDPMGAQRLRSAIQVRDSHEVQSKTPIIIQAIEDVMARSPITGTAHMSIREAAAKMTEIQVSSLLIVDEQEQLIGIITDRDLRKRVIVAGLDTARPVADIMTANPSTIESAASVSEAQLMMMRTHIHHIPVTKAGKLVGMITNTDLVRNQPASAVQLMGIVRKAEDVEVLATASERIPNILVNHIESGVDSHLIGKMITSVTDAIHRRLLELAHQKLGPSPVPYAWMVGGSQARYEQTAHSDQDNALILSDDYVEAEHGAYFEQLAIFMRDALDRCGYYLCPGDVMASNREWRQPVSKWLRYFSKWTEEPDPKALMLASVFFDIRFVAGHEALFTQVQQHMLSKTRGNNIFLAFMAFNALSHTPPLGFFRNFVLVRDKEHKDTFDLKHTGVVPIVDLARVYALDAGVTAVDTIERLKMAMDGGAVSKEGSTDLIDAMRFINTVRLRHQAKLIKQGKKADNFMPPEALTQFDRSHLKDAFSVVKTMQAALGQRFQVGRFG
ncbi:cyclic nucleotide-binding protein [Magnetococcus marinus MC-1]|uniref:Cyclic nucleotide-binding protein n=1 Tax=Magnetococcus marinus (strain ATCC BAA-1437 / JCM 17883 / MC-1) TaxID=156889 RepID=A0L6G8_MAGMM|nr:putative nucleotidyltransferase substrate binding domain-containing protein [Magnetococcus marinus]ABK43561.1 cyclic nucleotide-binding protein [Magnetococcus marinus MC-1]